MAEIKKGEGYVPYDIYRFSEVAKDAVIEFEFPYLKDDPDFIHYIDHGCGCTKAWFDFENKKIKGTLTIARAGNFNEGINPVNKTMTVMLDPSEPYFYGGPNKERLINEKKPWFRLTLTGTVKV